MCVAALTSVRVPILAAANVSVPPRNVTKTAESPSQGGVADAVPQLYAPVCRSVAVPTGAVEAPCRRRASNNAFTHRLFVSAPLVLLRFILRICLLNTFSI